jgi:hypothetical protein
VVDITASALLNSGGTGGRKNRKSMNTYAHNPIKLIQKILFARECMLQILSDAGVCWQVSAAAKAVVAPLSEISMTTGKQQIFRFLQICFAGAGGLNQQG